MTATPVRQIRSFAEIRDDVVRVIGDIVYCTMTTVGRRDRRQAAGLAGRRRRGRDA